MFIANIVISTVAVSKAGGDNLIEYDAHAMLAKPVYRQTKLISFNNNKQYALHGSESIESKVKDVF